jgi:hypothetical protein
MFEKNDKNIAALCSDALFEKKNFRMGTPYKSRNFFFKFKTFFFEFRN